MNKFNFDFLKENVSTQYNDYKGLSAIDNHGDGRDFYTLLKENNINPIDYIIYAVTMYDSEPVGCRGLKLHFYLIDKNIYGNSFDEISKYNGKIKLIEKYIDIPFSDLQNYVKRLSIGLVSPISYNIDVEVE